MLAKRLAVLLAVVSLAALVLLQRAANLPRAHAMRSALFAGDAEPAWVGPAAVSFLKVSPVLVCQVLWLSPLPTARTVIRRGSTEGLPPLGWFSMLANGFLWTVYGWTAGPDLTIIVPNVSGLLAGAGYSAIFMRYDSGRFATRPYVMGLAATLAAVTLVAIALPRAQAQRTLGLAGVAVCVAMFSGPLQVIRTVIATQSTRDLPFPTAVATVANCSLWLLFGALVRHDPFIWGPNVLGLGAGIAQLCLFARYGIHSGKGPVDARGCADHAKLGAGDLAV
jgi:solute carrier family 50 (sugar transporter)